MEGTISFKDKLDLKLYNTVEVEVQVPDPWQECRLRITLPTFNSELKKNYPNSFLLGDDLAKQLGTAVAKELLQKHLIAENHPIYKFGNRVIL